MKKLINTILAPFFMLAVVAAVPLYTDYVNNPNPGFTDNTGPQVPEHMSSW
jgi:hypothetical protein